MRITRPLRTGIGIGSRSVGPTATACRRRSRFVTVSVKLIAISIAIQPLRLPLDVARDRMDSGATPPKLSRGHGTASHQLNFNAARLNGTESPPKRPATRRMSVKMSRRPFKAQGRCLTAALWIGLIWTFTKTGGQPGRRHERRPIVVR